MVDFKAHRTEIKKVQQMLNDPNISYHRRRDLIGGFPLCWERCNGEGTAIWASEIEEFPIAVTKRHFPERGEQE